jgi:DNA helicase II / ATP-dependent DNA helicase PcrA
MAADLLSSLNPEQRAAVTSVEGPLLILAGPGSGKTRVIAHRIAYLVAERGVRPWRILSVTFTNKAAREMRERVDALLQDASQGIWLGTFHSICARILRSDGVAAGIARSFAIYDDGDQLTTIKRVLNDLSLDPKQNNPRAILSAISRAKNEMLPPVEYARATGTYFEEIVARVYRRYQDILDTDNALDFDDLLLRTLDLLTNAPAVLQKYQDRFQQVLVDEFQDTNVVQYALARELARGHGNFCVVGDPDQSIYRWRAADIRNILHFERDFPGTKTVLLEQNYRSTGVILEAAQSLIAAAEDRPEKGLWTENDRGLPITIYAANNEEDEAQHIVKAVEKGLRAGRKLSDFAVLYRTNAQSRPLEESFVRSGLRYRLIGGTRFYERREVKDVLAYLRLVANPRDSVSLARAINTPPRGIGATTVLELTNWARDHGEAAFAALRAVADAESGARPHDDVPHVVPRATRTIARFVRMIDNLSEIAAREPVAALIKAVVEEIDYQKYLGDGGDEGDDRWQNVQELANLAAQYDTAAGELERQIEQAGERPPEEDAVQRSALQAFLEDVALVSDVDDLDGHQDAVTLITLHAAKGLEFSIVFLAGVEEGLIPHMRSFDDPASMEEERRLAYVGMTRARQELHLSYALSRATWGAPNYNPPSRYLKDIPTALTQQSGRITSARAGAPANTIRTQSVREALTEFAQRPEVNPTPKPVNFVPGDRVRHTKFGDGVVISLANRPDGDIEVSVNFPGGLGIKRLLAAYAPLEKLR